MEIAVYRKLVECEEDRLGITASEFSHDFFDDGGGFDITTSSSNYV